MADAYTEFFNLVKPAAYDTSWTANWHDNFDALDAYLPKTIYKTADETVNNSDVLQDDNHLFFSVEENTLYAFEAELYIIGDADADFKFDWGGTAVITVYKYHVLGFNSTGTDINVNASKYQQGATSNWGDDISLTWTLDFNTIVRIKGIFLVDAGGGGTVKLRWAQDTAHASNLKVNIYSQLTYRKIKP